MVAIASFELRAVDLAFKKPFKHAEAERATSASIFLKCVTDTGAVGFGECLPREYVTGESRDAAFDALRERILPHLIDRQFSSMNELYEFLGKCDGKTPGWLDADEPQTAAWCATELALLDAFGKAFDAPVLAAEQSALPPDFRYSGVLSADKGFALFKSAFKQWLFGIRSVKLKVDRVEDDAAARLLHRAFLGSLDVRVDANMAWNTEQAIEAIGRMSRHGVHSYEQPIRADDTAGLARLVKETGQGIMADESFSDRDSLARLVDATACTAINLRISKCGGLTASLARAKEALAAGLVVQIGCQVGESSLLSAAHLILSRCVQRVTFAEGCFGLHLLRGDPVSPLMQFGYGGRPPTLPKGPGLGVTIDESVLERYTTASATVTAA